MHAVFVFSSLGLSALRLGAGAGFRDGSVAIDLASCTGRTGGVDPWSPSRVSSLALVVVGLRLAMRGRSSLFDRPCGSGS